ncbi:MAG: response regulator transcription factor [Isosphaeraceae bacterium]
MSLNVAESGAGRPLRILLVEDDVDASKGLARLLEHKGYVVRAVLDGRSALDSLTHEPAPDVLLTDVQLPDLDGLSIVREAKKLNPSTRIALITGWDFPSDEQEMKTLGVDGILLKPFEVRELIEFIEDL